MKGSLVHGDLTCPYKPSGDKGSPGPEATMQDLRRMGGGHARRRVSFGCLLTEKEMA